MKRRGVIRRAILPAIWVVIGAMIAVSLVKLAFLSSATSAGGDDPLKPTGEVPAETVPVEVGDVVNDLTVDGTIKLDAARTALASTDGEIAHVYAAEGREVGLGAPLFQIRTPKEAAASVQEDSTKAPRRPRPAGPAYTYTTVKAPTAGRVSPYAFAVGDPVSKGASVVSVQPHTFKAVGDITPLDRYRLLAKPNHGQVTIKGGPKPFRCSRLTVGDAASAATSPSNGDGGMGAPFGGEDGGSTEAASSVSCTVPPRVTVFDGLTMTMKISAGNATHVLVVPVTSVRGLLGNGTVWVLGADGTPAPREVRLGVTDGKVVEVVSGLTKEDSVLRYVPGSGPEGEGSPEEMMIG